MIVPDSKPPYFLLGTGAVLLAALVIRTLRRGRYRASTRVRTDVAVGGAKTARRSPAPPVKALPEGIQHPQRKSKRTSRQIA